MSARAERVITDSDGNETRVLFTNRAIAEAEILMGRPVMQMLTALTENKGSLGDIAGLLRAGMESARKDAKAGGKVISMNDAYGVMDTVGFAAVVGPVAEAIAAVISYSQDSPN